MINEFEGNEDAIFPDPEGNGITPLVIYEVFLEAFGFGERRIDDGVLVEVVGILVGNLVVFRLLTLFCLKYITFERR